MSEESLTDAGGSAEPPQEKKFLTVRQAAFIGVRAISRVRRPSRCRP